MAAAIKGKQLIWGISSAAKTAGDAAVTGGIITSFEISDGGSTEVIGDEDNDIVTRIDHAAEKKISIEVDCISTTTRPARGSELTLSGTIDGTNLAIGRTFVDDSKVVYQRNGVKKISITATNYPTMAADT